MKKSLFQAWMDLHYRLGLSKSEYKFLVSLLFLSSISLISFNVIQVTADQRVYREIQIMDSVFASINIPDTDTSSTIYQKKPEKPTIVKAINLNTASKSELTKLPGIGDKTAEKIIEYRQNTGKFKSIEDLKKVKGIGQKKFDQIKNLITVTD